MPHAPDLAGCALDGRYELHELIGEGTFGRVYRGYDRRLAREVAIKVIKPWWAEDPDWAESFEREAQLLARVSDPGIVQIFDVGQADEGLYYVTELVQGESLAIRLRRGGRLPAWEACDVAEQLCRALERAHSAHIVHRDIKPANVLISTRGRVKVGDLGIARLAEGTTEGGTATIVGTPRYMAPEQASGLPVTPATDVYSAGIVLYEMLAGRPPFNGDSPVEIALRHVQQPVPPLPPGTPRSLERIVHRALAKEPADRYQTAEAMADELAHSRAHPDRPASTSNGATASGRAAASNGTAARADSTAARADGTAARADGTAARADGTAARAPQDREPTRVAPRFSERRNVNPAARRRTVAAFVLALGVLVALVLARSALTAPATVILPELHGLSSQRVNAKLRSRHLAAAFSKRYDQHAKPGTVVAQTPAAGARVKQDSTVAVVLSKGPRPVDVSRLIGQRSDAAVAWLHRHHLEAKLESVPAPGTDPGTVTGQSPGAGHSLRQHQTVVLQVAETPSWHSVTSFSGTDAGHSVPFRIRGTQWRIVYHMSYDGTCGFVLFCDAPTAQVLGPGGGDSFGLNDGDTQTRVFKSGPGVYQVTIKPGMDSARWSMTVEDWL